MLFQKLAILPLRSRIYIPPTPYTWEGLWLLQPIECRGSDHKWLLSLGHKNTTDSTWLSLFPWNLPTMVWESQTNLESPQKDVLTDHSNCVSESSQPIASMDQQTHNWIYPQMLPVITLWAASFIARGQRRTAPLQFYKNLYFMSKINEFVLSHQIVG